MSHHTSRTLSRSSLFSWCPALVVASWLALVAVSSGAHAASRDDQENACRGDAFHFCSAEIPDTDKITACMQQHIKELSPDCQAMFRQGNKSADLPARGAAPKSP
jgi:hypothetical protein